ncbi:glycosyltransferase family 4 protein [Marinilabilia rubra]|uniref:Glycosyl transferase family 1 domain-containing protein n=1 Tax=Marinilabilia rubra TaxID=2162893 RepID=A0A2U2B4Q0_9BACT|nr:glycosyltransferase family 4 protein [Marinilabilia rubra]PWD98014.1 hypothetical protein DDZ16_17580 [Marinilabilia rubra]
MENLKTCFVGPFSPPYNGDGVKNTTLKEGLKERGFKNIMFLDTIPRDQSFFTNFFRILRYLLVSEQVILSLNIRGRYTMVPLVYLLSFFRKRRTALFVMGGAMGEEVKHLNRFFRTLFVKCLNDLDAIFVQSLNLKSDLNDSGVKNVFVVYNGKKDFGHRWQKENKHGRLVFASRITKAKGIFELATAVEILSREFNPAIKLDFYGPIDKNVSKDFERLLSRKKGLISYEGVLTPDKVQEVMSRYHLFILPTYHDGEGLPGIMIDAGFVGIPTILSRIKALDEFFCDKESVLFVPPLAIDAIVEKVKELYDNKELQVQLSGGLRTAVKAFTISNVVNSSLSILKNKGWGVY